MSQDLLTTSFGIGYIIFILVLAVVSLIGMWKLFEKAGKPGWAVLIPFYNLYCLYEIAFGVGWLFLILFVPCAGFVIELYMCYKLAKAFGHGVGFTIGLILCPPIFFMILGFDNSYYLGPQQ